ncbi:hypothetical protein L1049_016808 [Liquidambar formosana]|uniref:Gem-associated protein 2 n=1 Tax=Liquidambar formosana TaxID=63359 RepID=A0AAP0X7S0_LIQFO
MADDIDSDTCLRFKRRITDIEEDKRGTIVEQDSPFLSTEDRLSEIFFVTEEDQEIAGIIPAFAFDPVNIFPKKVKCSPHSDAEEKKEDVAGIAECGLGFSGFEEKKDVLESEYNKLGIAFDTENGEIAAIAENKEMVEVVGKDLSKDEVGFSAIEEASGDYTAIEKERKSVVEVEMGCSVQDCIPDLASFACSDVDENQGSLVPKNEEKQFLVESEAGSVDDVETHLVKVTDFQSSGETRGKSVKIEEGFEIDKKGCGSRTSETEELNKIVEIDCEKADGLKGNDGSITCSLKIEVIDETALIESVSLSNTGNGCGKETGLMGFAENTQRNCKNNGKYEMDGKKEKRPRRRGKGAKKGFEMNDKRNALTHICEARNDCGKNKGEGKRVYSRKEMEALRFVNVEKQQKMWYEVYCGLGPSVAKEYNDLVNCANQKHIRLNFDPRQQYGKKEEGPPILRAACSQDVDNEREDTNPLDPACGHGVSGEDGYTVSEEECSEDVESDEDYNSIQRPAFLVEGEPDFDSGPPQDGLEYLRRVRWEAAQIPKVKVAKLDRSKLNKEQTVYMPKIPDIVKCLEHLLPSKEWEDAFLADFSELRLALSCLEGSSAKASSKQPSTPILLESSGNYPRLSAILGMDSVARVSMLRRRISSVEAMSTLSRGDCLWLFALCAAVDTPLDADTSAALRCLLRKCSSLRAEKFELDDEVVMLNILATISGRFFGQSEN